MSGLELSNPDTPYFVTAAGALPHEGGRAARRAPLGRVGPPHPARYASPPKCSPPPRASRLHAPQRLRVHLRVPASCWRLDSVRAGTFGTFRARCGILFHGLCTCPLACGTPT